MLPSMRFDVTERDTVPVIYTASAGGPADIPSLAHQAWHDLEARIPITGRRAYGYWDPRAQEYRACYSLEAQDDPEAVGLKQSVIPGGFYRRARLKGDDVFDKIGAAFDKLAEDAPVDKTRPWFEFYRREDEVDIFVPIQS